MLDAAGKLIRIPMRYVDGAWVFEFGGVVPAVEGSTAELVVQESRLTDRALAKQLLAKSQISILDQGTRLRALLVIKSNTELTDQQRKLLLHWRDVRHDFALEFMSAWSTEPPSFVELELSGPTDRQLQRQPAESGGLWLGLEGMRPVGLISSMIFLPEAISAERAISLNHAFTILSEVYEPWRISHTGNVYTRFFYQESDRLWYPLELLRNAQVAKAEQVIAHRLWNDLTQRMASSLGGNPHAG